MNLATIRYYLDCMVFAVLLFDIIIWVLMGFYPVGVFIYEYNAFIWGAELILLCLFLVGQGYFIKKEVDFWKYEKSVRMQELNQSELLKIGWLSAGKYELWLKSKYMHSHPQPKR